MFSSLVVALCTMNRISLGRSATRCAGLLSHGPVVLVPNYKIILVPAVEKYKNKMSNTVTCFASALCPYVSDLMATRVRVS
jgi:hypothetical protein